LPDLSDALRFCLVVKFFGIGKVNVVGGSHPKGLLG